MKKAVILFLFVTLIQLIFAAWSDDATLNNAVCTLNGEQAIPKTAVCEDGTFYIAWFSNDSGNYDVRAQYYDYDGNEQWDTDGLLISDNEQMTWLTQWDICCDPAGNLILSFQDIRYNTNPDIFVYKIAPDGSFLWGDDGIAITNDDVSNMVATCTATTENNVIVAWMTEDGVGVQALSPDGDIVADPYMELVDTEITYSHPQLVPVENDCFIMKYFKDSGPTWSPTRHVYAMKYNSSLEEQWDNECVISTQGGISAWTQRFSISPDENGGFGICWHEDRDGDNMSNVYAQWVLSDGTTVYPDGGVLASTNEYTQGFYSFVVVDPVEEVLTVFWNEMDGDQNNRGLSGQKFDQVGHRLWTDAGQTLIAMGGDNPYPFGAQPAITDAMTQNSILFYTINAGANTDYIMAMCVDADGEQVWMDESVYICETANDVVHPVVSNPNNQYVFATWEDSRNGSADIYAQNISFDGELGPVEASSGISGEVTLDGGSGALEDVVITIGEITYNPNQAGFYFAQLDAGTYTIDFELEGYESATLEDVVVNEGEVTIDQNVTLMYIEPSGVSGSISLEGGPGDVSEVAITIGDDVYHPDVAGYYYILLDPGTYTIHYSLELFETVTLEDVVVTEGEINDGIDVTLEFIQAANNEDMIPAELEVGVYPNPFNPMTNIKWSIPEPGDVQIEVYDIKGRKVVTTIQHNQPAGEGSYSLNAEGFGSGIYFIRVNALGNSIVRKAVLLK